jgi:hypothetical protein
MKIVVTILQSICRPRASPGRFGRTIEETGEGDEVWDFPSGRQARRNGEKAISVKPSPKRALRAQTVSPSRVKVQNSRGAEASASDYTRIKNAVKVPMPGFVLRCLATLSRKPLESKNWLHEMTVLVSRPTSSPGRWCCKSAADWTGRPSSVGPSREYSASAIIDGEPVVEGETGA